MMDTFRQFIILKFLNAINRIESAQEKEEMVKRLFFSLDKAIEENKKQLLEYSKKAKTGK